MTRSFPAALPKLGNHTQQAGFTLIEIMMVVVIIGILASMIVPRIVGRTDDALVAKAQHDVRQIEGALHMYKLDNFNYPSTEQGLEALVSKPSGSPEAKSWRSGGYLGQLPKDPWGNEYSYLSPGKNGPFEIYSLGADNRPGGDGANADISNDKSE